ncbi:MAG: hypothetical protein ACJ72F_05410 [Nitrososphaeraceae archaeon]
MNGFVLSEEIKMIDDKVKICFLTAGEIPSKVRFDTLYTRRRMTRISLSDYHLIPPHKKTS